MERGNNQGVKIMGRNGSSIEIHVDNACKYFDDFCCLKDINLEIVEGEFHTFLGPSGCGKTTLLRMIAGLDMPSNGRILHNGEEIQGPSSKRGFMFQEAAAFPWRSVRRNIEFGLEIKKIPKKERNKISTKYMKLVGLDKFREYYPHQLSGGMRQKMVLATCLANNPKVLLMDEPFGALDAQTRSYMQKELIRIWEKTKKTIIFVTHSIREALILSNRVTLFKIMPGEIVSTYNLNETFGSPTERDLQSHKLMELESRIYTKLRSYSGFDY